MITTIILFILILGAIIFVHELGHFLFAKLTDVYVYEFSIGMGPKIWSKKGKETEYCLRAIPIGGFVQLAGEEIDDDKSIPKIRKLQAKKPWERFLVMFFGAGFNFLFAILLLFLISLFSGSPKLTPIITKVDSGYPAEVAGLSKGDRIIKINNHNIDTTDDVTLFLGLNSKGKETTIKVDKGYGTTKTYKVTPKQMKQKGQTIYRYGITLQSKKHYGLINAFEYTFVKTKSIFKQMGITVGYLFTGKIRLNQLSGPVGIYSIVGKEQKSGLASILYLVAFLSINVGFINLLPLPAFDGGHILFILIEMIKGSPVDPKVENTIHTIGLVLLMLLMVYITFNDILRLF